MQAEKNAILLYTELAKLRRTRDKKRSSSHDPGREGAHGKDRGKADITDLRTRAIRQLCEWCARFKEDVPASRPFHGLEAVFLVRQLDNRDREFEAELTADAMMLSPTSFQ